jgi:hypothetical protein
MYNYIMLLKHNALYNYYMLLKIFKKLISLFTLATMKVIRHIIEIGSSFEAPLI